MLRHNFIATLLLVLCGIAFVGGPAQARFLQTDPVGYKDDINWYAYVGNDPTDKTDPSGLWTCYNCNPEERKRFNETQDGIKRDLGKKIGVLQSLQSKVANGGKLTGAETQAAGAINYALGNGAANDKDVIGSVIRFAQGIVTALNSSDPMNASSQYQGGAANLQMFGTTVYRDDFDRGLVNGHGNLAHMMVHESARVAGARIAGGYNRMTSDWALTRSGPILAYGAQNMNRIAATGADPQVMLETYPDASTTALGY